MDPPPVHPDDPVFARTVEVWYTALVTLLAYVALTVAWPLGYVAPSWQWESGGSGWS